MPEGSVFIVYCELSGESPPLREQGYAGAFVACIVATTDISEAISEAERTLRKDGYMIVDIDKALRFATDDWEHDPGISSLAAEVLSSGDSAYSEFEVWGH